MGFLLIACHSGVQNEACSAESAMSSVRLGERVVCASKASISASSSIAVELRTEALRLKFARNHSTVTARLH